MLNQDFRDILSCLKNEEVEFIVVGAYALATHGFPRATGDIDIWVRNDPANARKTFQALMKFGAPLSDLAEKDLNSPDVVLQIGVEPCRIDLMTAIDGVEFDKAWSNRIKVVIDDLEISVLSKADLLINKLAASRDQDQGDIAWLKRNQESTASLDGLEVWRQKHKSEPIKGLAFLLRRWCG